MKLSIITINYNTREGLRRTIGSVAGQTMGDFEYIVIDGRSGDGSIEVLGDYADDIDKTLVEADRGPFEAMNKGAKIATGDYLLFLNSGDCLIDAESLSRIGDSLLGKDLYYCDATMVSGAREWLLRYPESLDLDRLITDPINHQNLFVKRLFFIEQGGYEEGYDIISDWAFMVRAYFKGRPEAEHLDCTISRYFLDGRSSLKANGKKTLDEKRRFLESLSREAGSTLFNYIELRDSEYGRLRARIKNRALFDAIMKPGILVGKAMSRMGLLG